MKRAILTTALLLALPVGIAAQSAPDLVVPGPNVSKTSVETGETFWFIATVTNDGDAQSQSAATTVRYLRSTDATITESDTEEGTDEVRALLLNQGYAATIRLTAPSTAGTYYYGACVDAVADESDTTNNCSTSVQVDVSEPPTTGGGGGGGGTPSQPPPGAPRNLLLESGDGQVTLTWDAPEDDGGAAITDYEYRINGQGRWISTGSTDTTYTVTGLDNDTVYTFQLRSVNRNGRSQATDRIEATPRAPVALAFTHFTNGRLMTSEIVLVNVETRTIRPALYFYDQGGEPIDPESVVDVTGDLEITGDGALTVQTAMEPLGELTVATHGRGESVSGSVRVVSDGTIGGVLRFDIPGLGVAGVGTSAPVHDALFPVRRQEGGINTGVALHNLEAEAMGVSCHLMSGGVALEEVEFPLEANGQTARFIDQTFTATDTSDFLGAVRCTAPGAGRFTAIAMEIDAAGGIFTTVPVVEVNRGGAEAATLDFAHFANGTWITDLVFVNRETRQSGPPLTPFHTAILPSRPVIYFYDTEGNPIAPELLVDITGDLEVTEDGTLTVRTEMEPLGVLTISTHGRGESGDRIGAGGLGGSHRRDAPVRPPRPWGGRGGSQHTRQRRHRPGAPSGGRNHDGSRAPQPGIGSGAGALRIEASGRRARRRDDPAGR